MRAFSSLICRRASSRCVAAEVTWDLSVLRPSSRRTMAAMASRRRAPRTPPTAPPTAAVWSAGQDETAAAAALAVVFEEVALVEQSEARM